MLLRLFANVTEIRNDPVFTRKKSNGVVRPVHVLTLQAGNVALARPQVPAKLIQGFAFGVHLGGNDPLVFLQRDGAFLLELHFRPLALRQDGP